MKPSLGRIVHVRPFDGLTTSETEWWAAIVVQVTEGETGAFSVRDFYPFDTKHDTVRTLIEADEGKTWRWPPEPTCPNCRAPMSVCEPQRAYGVCTRPTR